MGKLIFILTIFISIHVFSDQNYAVATKMSTDLMDKNGFIVEKIRQGTIIKVRTHDKDKSSVVVLFEGKKYFAAKRDFRVIESILDEEVKVLKRVSLLREKVSLLASERKYKFSEIESAAEKLLRVERWIEVHKDNAISYDYFIEKTKKARALKNEMERKAALQKLEFESIKKDLEIKQLELKEESIILKALQDKLKPLKAEKSLFDKGFMTIRVIAEYAPVFHNGKIVKYLEQNTVLKVGVDHNSGDWYVMNRGSKKYYIASSDVRIKF